jgi:hypothetical protein
MKARFNDEELIVLDKVLDVTAKELMPELDEISNIKV